MYIELFIEIIEYVYYFQTYLHTYSYITMLQDEKYIILNKEQLST